MRFEQLDLNLLVALDVLLEEQNISRTAEKLYLSQSATSSILARLRDYFKDDLFVQVGRKMQPTPYALELQSHIKEMLNIVRGSITHRRQMDLQNYSRHFRIIVSDYILQVFLTDVIKNVSKEAPNLSFEFLTPFTIESDALSRSSVDMMIAPEQVMIEGYSTAFFTSDELVCIADKNNPRVSEGLSRETFCDCGHISVGFGRVSLLSIEKWLVESKALKRRIEVITNDFTTMCRMIVGTERLALLPKKFAELNANFMPLKILPLPFEAPSFTEHLMWHPTLDSDPVHSWLRDKIIAQGQISQQK